MNYTDLIETISLIVENPNIQKTGLSLLYELPDNEHNEINKILNEKANPYSINFIPSDEFEVMLGGVLVKFKKSS